MCGWMPARQEVKLEDIVHIEETALTVRGYRRRTTVPSRIFKFLKLKDGDVLRWIATKDGRVFLLKAEPEK